MKLFQRAQRSVFGEILDWMLTPLLLLIPVSIGVTWLVAQGIANAAFDRTLQFNARVLAARVAADPARAFTLLDEPGLRKSLAGHGADEVYWQVLDAQGGWLAGERDLPLPGSDDPPVPGSVYLRDGNVDGRFVRVAFAWVLPGAAPAGEAAAPTDPAAIAASAATGEAEADPVLTPLPGRPVPILVQLAETRAKQAELANEIIKGVLLPQFALLPLAVLLIWLALVRGIKPLSAVESRIRERMPGDLRPLDAAQVPLEIEPLVASVNELLGKLGASMATQRRFLADAAHQLKTPLAGLRMQADLALRESASADELKLSLKQIGRASMRASRTVNQLLAMARAEAGAGARQRQPCDLARLAIEVVREAVPRAIDKSLDLGYDGAQPGAPGVQMEGNPTLLKELVRNLVDNAIAYTPSSAERPGVITARVLGDPFGRVALLQVEDNGPGIAEAERELVFEPFYRVLGSDADGSGLGLPIVREIARQHGARVTLEDAHPGRQPPGTRFTVRFETAPGQWP